MVFLSDKLLPSQSQNALELLNELLCLGLRQGFLLNVRAKRGVAICLIGLSSEPDGFSLHKCSWTCVPKTFTVGFD